MQRMLEDGKVETRCKPMEVETIPGMTETSFVPQVARVVGMSFGDLLDLLINYAMEKSTPLLTMLPKEVVVIGTDFRMNTLIDKPMDIIFTNPPYSEYEAWTEKVIIEANTTLLYLIIPKRWKESKGIREAIKARWAFPEVIYSGDFLDAPRSARAEIDIVRIDYRGKYEPYETDIENPSDTQKRKIEDRKYYSRKNWKGKSCTDPFSQWFYKEFKKNCDNYEDFKESKEPPKSFKEKVELVPGANLIERMENLYQTELHDIQDTYTKLQSIDPKLLKRLGVDQSNILEGVRTEIRGLKHLYWEELFRNLTDITNKLTAKSRKSLMGLLHKNLSVDFSASNAYAIVIWVIKNANSYYDSQLIDAYQSLITPESIIGYKSNRHLNDDTFRYTENAYQFARDKNINHYYLNDKLDYRIVCHQVGGIAIKDNYWEDGMRGVAEGLLVKTYDYLKDVTVIARNLGYDILDYELDTPWTSGGMKKVYIKIPGDYKIGNKTVYGKVEEVFPTQYKIKGEIYHKDIVPKIEVLYTARAYKNKNIHFKFNQEFLRKWNVEFGRLKGWINNKNTAAEEMNIPMEEMNKLFACNYQIEKTSDVLLLEKVV